MTPPDFPNSSGPERDASGRYLPGHGGRRPGSRNKIAHETIKKIQEMRGDAIQQLRNLVTAGDIKEITYVLDRIIPKNGRTIELDDTRPSTIAEMLADGSINPEEARDIAATIKSLREIEELEQLRAKLIELEAIVGDGTGR